ncbi:MAG: hypothetical protein BWK73_02605 [Thiothrix lacustris]|uniref:Methyltransferase domain-containing protein n=1 Tax=Thiothrix lacustris TaxID=525917 RepID=A0A1Y1QZ18_9GAMM|nr:MAG: hypothetical protein BWK73_02605 [Thiothrix lacustris]
MIKTTYKSDAERIREMGHRAFVGGDGIHWDEIAKLQFNFLISEGLQINHTLIDVACGSLRAGRLFVNYLNAGNYFGIDKEINLIIHGVAEELGISSFIEKKPNFVVSGDFDFTKFSRRPDFGIAQSLLTHLTAEDIYLCFKSLRKFIAEDGKFYATFFEVQAPINNYATSDAIDCFFYSRDQLNSLADVAGWRMQYIGDWGHPRDQKMIKLEPK